MAKSSDSKISGKEASQAAKALELLFATEYVDKKRLYLANFLRGIFFGLGAGVGATLLVGLGLWVLSWFDSAPLVGPLIENLKSTINSTN